MGMFDRISFAGSEYQTTDLDNALDRYEITADGVLLIQTTEYRPGHTLSGFQRVAIGHAPVDYTGTIEFYDEARSFEVRFANGQLKDIH